MSDTPTLDDTQPKAPSQPDTQPKSPFQPLPGEGRRPPRYVDPDEPEGGRGGCGLMGLLGVVIALFAIAIVALAGAAGWTAGTREALSAATATQGAAISEQLNRIPNDVASGNTVLLDTRLRFLQSLGVPQANEIAPTATTLFLSLQPTATPTITPTLEATATAAPETSQPDIQITQASGGYDLASIFQQAQAAFSTAQYQDAIDYLDVILRIDGTFNTSQVRQLMSQALNARAMELYTSLQPAAANLLVDRAREFGPLANGMEYESYAATLYLNARAAIGTSYPAAIQALMQVLDLGEGGRYYDECLSLLIGQYEAYGDALGVQGQYCPASDQYRNALRYTNSGTIRGKLVNAANLCENGTPTPDPALSQSPITLPDGSGQPIAPIGVPGS